MVKLNKIIINGFKDPLRNVELEFSNEMISVIFGENGSGKTTLLKIIHSILAKDETLLIRENVREVILYFTEGFVQKSIRVFLENEDVDGDDETITHYNWKELENSGLNETSSILFGVNRGMSSRIAIDHYDVYRFISQNVNYRTMFKTSSKARIFAKELTVFLKEENNYRRKNTFLDRKNLGFNKQHLLIDDINIDTIQEIIFKRYSEAKMISSERVQKALFDTLSFAINPQSNSVDHNYSIDEENFIDQLSNNKEKLIEALNNTANNGLRNELLRILKNNDLREIMAYCSKSDLLSSLLYRMIQELKEEQNILESINMLEEIFNNHLSQDKKIVITNDEIYIDLKTSIHSLNELSSGERHLLTFLTLFLIEGVKKQFLIIDEPELSLNIKWQREILPLLHQLAPNSQIIVASHSPSISKKNTNYLVKLK
ncbi:AAA family ATPase [Bacillus cereus]|uniref:AAA family ATPase n=1 Tax=Bacillus cereus TaxID=1396 RepID=UPI000BF4485A|nr:AAA family ATPase [Bacillus cereus]PFT36091.1 hypothetical protein COK71_09780 [Bacillus cereus]